MLSRAVFALALMSAPALAEVSLTLPIDAESGVISASYTCGEGQPFVVQYINTADNQLALIPVDGTERIFVNVVSASGARYVSAQYEWWSKGDDATLRNVIEDEDGKGQQCTSADLSASE